MATTTQVINSGTATLVSGIATVTATDLLATDQILVTRSHAINGRGPTVCCELCTDSTALVVDTSFTVVSLQNNAGAVNSFDNSEFAWAIIRTTTIA